MYVPVDELVCGRFVEGVVKSEMLIVQILGQVHLGLGLVDDDLVLVGTCGHVDLLPLVLLVVQGPLPHADRDLVVHEGVVLCQRIVLQLLLVLSDHGEELPVGIARVILALGILELEGLRLFGSPLLTVLLQALHFFDHVGTTPI